MRIFRWPVLASLAGHGLVLAAIVVFDPGPPEPQPKPVEIALAAPPESLEALTLKADATPAVQPQAAQVVQSVETVPAVPVDQPPPPVAVDQPPPVPVETVRAAEPVEPVQPSEPETVKPPPPDVAEVVPLEEIEEVKPEEPPPLEPTPVLVHDLPKPKPARPAPPRPQIAQRAPAQPVTEAPPAPPAPPAQTALLAPPAPRPALPAGPSNSYLAALRAQLERHKNYPETARRRQLEGTTMVRFVINRGGAVISQRIVRSSGYEMLDQEVSAMLTRASPLPPLPPEVEADQLEIVVPINFSMR